LQQQQRTRKKKIQNNLNDQLKSEKKVLKEAKKIEKEQECFEKKKDFNKKAKSNFFPRGTV
jgi:hypothetical protein